MTGQADRNLNPDDHPRDQYAQGPSQPAQGEAVTRPNADGELVLIKHGQRFVFKCAPGGEKELLGQLAQMADDPDNDLTWFDAAVLSHQMGQGFGQALDSYKLKAS